MKRYYTNGKEITANQYKQIVQKNHERVEQNTIS